MTTLSLDRDATSVFVGSDGAICHEACWRPLEYHGVRGAREVDFYCPECVAHVSLPMHRLPAIRMASHSMIWT